MTIRAKVQANLENLAEMLHSISRWFAEIHIFESMRVMLSVFFRFQVSASYTTSQSEQKPIYRLY
ncbi:MAG TPA: hypothetical protein DCP92_19860 [Nitrospiraceae bacterium]|nr:hypothetical protein [Nitrospiraceae bacterium]